MSEELEPGETLHVEVEDVAAEVRVFPPAGKLRETSRALLDAAAEVGARPNVVKYTDGTFIAPEDVVNAAELPEDTDTVDEAAATDDDAEPDELPEGEPDDSWTKAQIYAYGEAHNIDLPSNATKAQLLDALDA